MSLLDGRIDCDVTEQIEGGNEYYEALEQLNCPSMLMGRVTMQMHYALPEPFVAESTEPIGQEQCHVAIKKPTKRSMTNRMSLALVCAQSPK